MMYFDTVLADEGKVLFNDTPKAVYTWLVERRDSVSLENAWVVSGYNHARHKVDEYLAITQA